MTNAASGAPEAGEELSAMVRVWDPLVRVFHWSLVAAFAISWITADEWKSAHVLAGYAVVVLIGFRIVWGFVGPRRARFADFLFRPATVLSFLFDSLKMRAKRHLGHNPAGGAMVIALLALLGVISVSGIMMRTDAFWGVEWVEDLHEVAANLSLLLVALHLGGVALASLEHGENLVRAMITGRKRPLD